MHSHQLRTCNSERQPARFTHTCSSLQQQKTTMPKICDLIAEKAKAGEDWVSYEFFPPRTEQGVKNLVAGSSA